MFDDPSLQAQGYATGQAGKDALAQSYKDYAGGSGAYIAFFSKYSQSHFSYMPTSKVDLSTCSIAMTVGVLARLTGCLFTKLGISSMLLMNAVNSPAYVYPGFYLQNRKLLKQQNGARKQNLG